MALTTEQRSELRMKFGGKCAYCGCELPDTGWHADHVEPLYRGRDFNRSITDSGHEFISATVCFLRSSITHRESRSSKSTNNETTIAVILEWLFNAENPPSKLF